MFIIIISRNVSITEINAITFCPPPPGCDKVNLVFYGYFLVIAKIMADSATVAALSYRLAVIPEDDQSVPEYLVVYWSIESGLLSTPANRFSVRVRVSFT